MSIRYELAWAAGFADGEGCFHLGQRNVVFTAVQVDRRVLDRFARATHLGRVYGPYASRTKNQRPKHQYHVTGFENVQALTILLWRWLSPVKRQQAKKVLVGWLEFLAERERKRWSPQQTMAIDQRQKRLMAKLAKTQEAA